jgi:membrane protein DedA with SNARE-associated domain
LWDMESLLSAVASWDWVVYAIAFGLVLLQSAGVPLPALTFVSLAAALAGHMGGGVDFWPVYVATIVGGALGGVLGYGIGERGGRPLLERLGKGRWITAQRIEVGERYFQRHGDKAVLIGRYLPVLCFMGGVLSGTAQMARKRFLAYNAAGIILWATTQLLIAYYLGAGARGLF